MNIFAYFYRNFFLRKFMTVKNLFARGIFFGYIFFSVRTRSRRVRNLVYWGVPGDKTDRDMSDRGHLIQENDNFQIFYLH